jgi:ElaA protein
MVIAMIWNWCPFDALSASDLYTVLRLRQEVFVVEQDCAYLDADGSDAACHHLLGWREGVLAAYLRVFPPGTCGEHPEVVIGRVITAASARGEGLGRTLMEEGHRQSVQTWGAQPIWLSAQAHLARFYGSLGYVVCGPGYDEDGIPHLPMRRPAAG